MKLRGASVSVAFLLCLFAPDQFGQVPRPRPPVPKPVEDVPPPDIGPASSIPTPDKSQSAPGRDSDTRRWAMFDGSQWPSDQQLAGIVNLCGYESSISGVTPDSRETIALETAVENLKEFIGRTGRRKIIVTPVYSPQVNAWNTNMEDVKRAAGLPSSQQNSEIDNVSLICVSQSLIDIFLDAPEELQAIVAHEMGHAFDIPCYHDVRPQSGFPLLIQQACESRADAFALNAFIIRGKNPYAVAGAFGRLEMLLGDTSTGFFARFRNLASDHPLTPDRIRDLRRMLAESQRTHKLQLLPPIAH